MLTFSCRLSLLAGAFLFTTLAAPAQSESRLREALTFHASFDRGVDADFALGDARLHTAPSFGKRAQGTPGFHTSNFTVIARGAGRFGDALRFTKRKAPLVYFNAASNVIWRATNWSGTVSFWLNTDPVGELEMGFCDPIQITPRAWNDAAFFVEFEKRSNSIPFRLGAYPDYKVWNPDDVEWEKIPATDKPLLGIKQHPFTRGKWTHVVFAFENFNTDRKDGVARLYLDGRPQGVLGPREQTFSWDPSATSVQLGLSYIGLFDELSFFNRALSDAEIKTLHELPRGVSGLLGR